jgi:hypothetical protein
MCCVCCCVVVLLCCCVVVLLCCCVVVLLCVGGGGCGPQDKKSELAEAILQTLTVLCFPITNPCSKSVGDKLHTILSAMELDSENTDFLLCSMRLVAAISLQVRRLAAALGAGCSALCARVSLPSALPRIIAHWGPAQCCVRKGRVEGGRESVPLRLCGELFWLVCTPASLHLTVICVLSR